MQILYLHGFASSPRSSKAAYFSELLRNRGHTVIVPDLNRPSFESLSIEAVISAAEDALSALSAGEVVLMGSSLGGYTALQLLQRGVSGTERVTKLVLLAPAFGFRNNKQLTEPVLAQWKTEGRIPVHHSGTGNYEQLNYSFIEGFSTLEAPKPPNIPTLIVHGDHDETIDVQLSRDFVKRVPKGRFIEVDSDHSLINVLPAVGEEVIRFIE